MIRNIQSATDLAPAYDLVVVGAGPAGLSAAIEASIHGLAVLLADENESPGGQIYRSVEHASDADLARMGPDYAAGRTLIERFRQRNLSYAPGATVWSVGPADEEASDGVHPLEVGISLGGIARPIAAHRVILATGALERPFPFPGWTMPGVMTAGAAQILMKSSGLVPSGRTILAGTGPLLYLVASQLLRAGVSVVAVVDTTPAENWRLALPHMFAFATSPYAVKGLKLLLDVRRRAHVIRGVAAIEAAGSGQFSVLKVRRGDKFLQIEGDLLLLHQGIAPNLNLALAAGCDYGWDRHLATFRPTVDLCGASSVESVSIAGDAAGIVGAVAAALQGELAGLSAALNLNRIGQGYYQQRRNRLARKLARALRGRTFIERRFRPDKTFRVPEDGGTIVCRCEEITAGKLREVAALGVPGPNQMKAFTRCGMGPCQGRLCGLTAVELLAQCRGQSPGEAGYYRLRPPIKPVTLGELAALPHTEAAIVAVAGFAESAKRWGAGHQPWEPPMKHAHRFYVDGEWSEPSVSKTLEVIDPSTEEPMGTIALGSAADAEKAVAAARRAFASFSQTSKEERVELLKRIVTILKRRNDELGDVISREMGAPLAMARAEQAGIGALHFEQTIKALETFAFEYMQGTTCIMHEPIGVVAMITPWNWPINQIACKVAPALATGCTMVLKPSEIAPFNAVIFAEIMDEAGVPNGVFNLVHGDGPTIGTALASHPDVDMVSFTGSTRAGIAVAQAAAPTVKRVHQELGGKSPNIILRSADFSAAVAAGVRRCFGNSGQTCTSPTRMLVPIERMDEASSVAAREAAALVVGPPSDPRTDLGPVASAAQFDKIQALIERGIAEGAELVAGGPGRPSHLNSGYYVRPTVFARVTNQMTIAREEIFGPVLSIIGYDSEDEAIAIANDTPYGLAAYIQGDPKEARALAGRLRAGSVRLNSSAWDSAAPFGGYKQSGNGREYGKFGLHEFTEIKGIVGFFND